MTHTEALRLALAALEDFVYHGKSAGWSEAMTALRAALAAPSGHSEPVAWYFPAEGGDDSMFRDHRTIMACTGNKWEGWIPLYATPQPALAGWRLVPETPTPAMLDAFNIYALCTGYVPEGYRAMLDAAPAAPKE